MISHSSVDQAESTYIGNANRRQVFGHDEVLLVGGLLENVSVILRQGAAAMDAYLLG